MNCNPFLSILFEENLVKDRTPDSWRMAVHNAGHLMCFAALESIPTFDIMSYTGIKETKMMEWVLLNCLAGREIERYALKAPSESGQDDLEMWESLSGEYLMRIGRISEADEDIVVAMKKNELLGEQANMLCDLIVSNMEAALSLANHLYSETLITNELKRLLDDIVLPINFPVPQQLGQVDPARFLMTA